MNHPWQTEVCYSSLSTGGNFIFSPWPRTHSHDVTSPVGYSTFRLASLNVYVILIRHHLEGSEVGSGCPARPQRNITWLGCIITIAPTGIQGRQRRKNGPLKEIFHISKLANYTRNRLPPSVLTILEEYGIMALGLSSRRIASNKGTLC